MKKKFYEPILVIEFFNGEVFMSPNVDIGWDDLLK